MKYINMGKFKEGDRVVTIDNENTWDIGYTATVGPDIMGPYTNIIWDRYDSNGKRLMSHYSPDTVFDQNDGGYFTSSFILHVPMYITRNIKKHKI